MKLHKVKEEKKKEKAVFMCKKQICEQHFVFSIPIKASFPLWYEEFAIIPNSEFLLLKLLPLVSSTKEVFLNEAQINQVFGISICLNLKGECYVLLCASIN
ncbi:hypothetical protein QOT17_003094 [Balamuthia mandrillaris]